MRRDGHANLQGRWVTAVSPNATFLQCAEMIALHARRSPPDFPRADLQICSVDQDDAATGDKVSEAQASRLRKVLALFQSKHSGHIHPGTVFEFAMAIEASTVPCAVEECGCPDNLGLHLAGPNPKLRK